MNFLIFFENEISADKKSAKITDKERISYIKEKFVLEKDKSQNAGIFEGNLGTAKENWNLMLILTRLH